MLIMSEVKKFVNGGTTLGIQKENTFTPYPETVKLIPPKSPDEWLIERKGYRKAENGYFESLFVLSNGYIGIRNTLDFSDPNIKPGIFVAGLYDNAPVVFSELANLPSWLRWEIFPVSHSFNYQDFDSGGFTLHEGEKNFYQALDMQKGALYTSFILTSEEKSEKQKEILVETFQFPHTLKKELYLSIINITPLNFTGKISIRFFLENNSHNEGLYPWLHIHHLKTKETGFLNLPPESSGEDSQYKGVYLLSKTRVTEKQLLQCSITMPYPTPATRNVNYRRGYSKAGVWEEMLLNMKEGKTYPFCRLVFNKILPESSGEKILTELPGERTKKTPREDPRRNLKNDVEEFSKLLSIDIQKLITSHTEKWKEKWEKAWIYLEGDSKSLEAVRFSTFQLLQAYDEKSPLTSIPAKGLTGEGYKGHIFWDTEIFMLPFYLYTNPEVAKRLLLYRVKRLNTAKENAQKTGTQGARFPWESAESGKEVTPYEIYDFVDEKTYFIYTGKEELHVTADIAYAVIQYYNATGDREFLLHNGLPLLIETARFWASKTEWDDTKKAFVIKKVIGPDEFHEHVDNSFFTNFMAAWNLEVAAQTVEEMKNFTDIEVKAKELQHWKHIAENIYLPTSNDGILEEFEGYFELENVTIKDWDSNSMPIIPEEVKERVEKTQLIKQGDVVLLFHLHPNKFKPETIKKNFLYYEARTTHNSSLSPMVYAIVGLKIGIEDLALKNFLRTSRVDLDNNQGNIQLGLHLAACGGTWQAVVNGFAGVSATQEKIEINPRLPESWHLLEFRLNWRANTLKIEITQEATRVELENSSGQTPKIKQRVPQDWILQNPERIPVVVSGVQYLLDEKNRAILAKNPVKTGMLKNKNQKLDTKYEK